MSQTSFDSDFSLVSLVTSASQHHPILPKGKSSFFTPTARDHIPQKGKHSLPLDHRKMVLSL